MLIEQIDRLLDEQAEAEAPSYVRLEKRQVGR